MTDNDILIGSVVLCFLSVVSVIGMIIMAVCPATARRTVAFAHIVVPVIYLGLLLLWLCFSKWRRVRQRRPIATENRLPSMHQEHLGGGKVGLENIEEANKAFRDVTAGPKPTQRQRRADVGV